MIILVLDVLWQVVSRYLLSSPSSFTDELAGFLLIWVGFIGAAYTTGLKGHLAIDILHDGKSFLKPMVGYDKLMRDPCIIQAADNKFHLVWTVSWAEKGIGYAYSEDLINWSEQQYLPVMEHEEKAVNCWAPEVFWDDKEGIYIIYWSTTIPGRFPKTDTIERRNKNHRIYYTLTEDFKNFTETKILYDPGFNVIDAVIKKHASDYLMFVKDETHNPIPIKSLKIAKSKHLTHGYGSASNAISPDWVEGPTIIKEDGKWIVYFDLYTKGQMGAIESKDLEPWNDISHKVNFPKGTRHGTILRIKKEQLKKLMERIESKSP
jgi:hypothetical protein